MVYTNGHRYEGLRAVLSRLFIEPAMEGRGHTYLHYTCASGLKTPLPYWTRPITIVCLSSFTAIILNGLLWLKSIFCIISRLKGLTNTLLKQMSITFVVFHL